MATTEFTLPDTLDLDAFEAGVRVRRIRDRLLGQTLGERVAQARARYGRVYTLAELRAAACPRWRAWLSRPDRGFMEPLESYQAPIPDDALLRYDDASETAWFSRFCVVTPASSGRDRSAGWIVGELRGGVELFAIVARWHTPAGQAAPKPWTREGGTGAECREAQEGGAP
jgi:hypothetical protein